jgi:2-methylfumaryl-CoA hydratase
MPAPPAARIDTTAATLEISRGNYFEDHVRLFKNGEVIRHTTSRTVTAGDVAVYTALFGQRYAVTSDDEFARAMGFDRAPVPWMLLFHMGFGKTVPDVSQLAVANLGYSDIRFLRHVYPGDSLFAETRIIGYKENFNLDKATGAKTPRGNGNVYVHSTVFVVTGDVRQPVLDFKRVVMVNKKHRTSNCMADLGVPEAHVPDMPVAVAAEVLCEIACAYPGRGSTQSAPFAAKLADAGLRWEDYAVGMRIDHGERRQITSAHMELPNLTQNTAKVHFAEGKVDEASPVVATGIVYGGHVMSMADAQAYYGFENTLGVIAINNGKHVAPCFEGESVAAWSVVEGKLAVPGREDIGLLVVRTVAAKNMPAGSFPDKDAKGQYTIAATIIDINGRKHSADTGIVLDYERVVVMLAGARGRPKA